MYFICWQHNYFFKTFEGLCCPFKVIDEILHRILSFGLKDSSLKSYETARRKRLGEVKIQFSILGDAKRKEKGGHGEVLMPGDR